jgi:lipid II:glycine glycyltransferase (peptidoglycan interpeptide bridge formation enzyme)
MGPLWRRKGQPSDPEDFRQAVRALRNELVCRMGVSLRLTPYAWNQDDSELAGILEEEGFWRVGGRSVRAKLIMDITPAADKLMSGMGPHWRRNLRKAQRNGLRVAEGNSPEFFSEFRSIFQGYLRHKGLKDESKLDCFHRAQEQLPDGMKMRVLLCRDATNPHAGLVYSCINDNAFFLHSAVSAAGLESRGSYLLHWEAIQQCKAAGAKSYDLDCIDPVGNPGSFRYKSDLAGVHGRPVHSLGRFDAVADWLGYRALLLAERVITRARPRITADGLPAT